MWAAFAASATSTWSAVRVSGIQVSDILLILWVALLVVSGGPAIAFRAPRWLLLPVVGAGLAMTLQVVVDGSSGAPLAGDLDVLIRLFAATVVVPAVVLASAHLYGAGALRVILQGWLLSAAISVLAELHVTRGGSLPNFVIHDFEAAGRGFGLALHPNSLGLTCVLALPFFLGGIRGYAPISARFAVPGAALMLVGLYLADSRAALLAGGVVLLLAGGYLCTTKGAWPIGLPVLLLVVAGALVYLPRVVADSRLSGSGSAAGSDALRAVYRDEALALIDASPIFGHQLTSIGAGVMTLLGLLVAGGIIFALAYYAYFLAALRKTVVLMRQGHAMAALCLISTIAFLAVGLAQPSTVERYTFWPIGMALAVAVGARRNSTQPGPVGGPPAGSGRTSRTDVAHRWRKR
jgi:hypothetical protein